MKAHTALKLALMTSVVTAQVAVAGSSVNPTPIVSGDRCYRCDRLISNRWVASETVAEGNVAYKFRTVRCMLTYLTATERVFEKIFVADDQTGKFIDVEDAVFVPVLIDVHTGLKHYGLGAKNYIAFKSLKAAERFAADHGVKTMSWLAVVVEAAFLPPSPRDAD